MPYELIITQANNLIAEIIGFGENQAMAERVFNWTTTALMRDEGCILMSNANKPQFVEVIQRRGLTLMFIELRYVPCMPQTAALSNHTIEIETFYRALCCGGGSWLEVESDFIRETESNIRTEWHRLGLYAKRGYDYDGKTYNLLDSDMDDLEVMAAMEERVAQRELEEESQR